jgi:phosphomevalonate kinase
MLAGEYAVLEGWPAIVCAVDRRVTARVTVGERDLSAFLQAADNELRGRGRADAADRLAQTVVDSHTLFEGTTKLGLGSSAASTVAAVAAALDDDHPDLVHAIAHAAHGMAQEPRGARGSGADVAASVYGGLLRVSPREGTVPTVERLTWPHPVEMVLVWTGQPADTPALVARVRAFRARDPAGYRFGMAVLGECAARFLDDPLQAVAVSGDLLGALGRAAGCALATPASAILASLAQKLGGAAKPTGAGGGDLVLSLFCDPDAAARFRARVAELGMRVIVCGVDLQGLELAEGSDSE